LNPKSWYSRQKELEEMIQGIQLLRIAFNCIRLGCNGGEEQWEITQLGKGGESCAS
jgi:hypothetical protein